MLPTRAQKLVDALPPDFEAALIQTEVSRFYLLDFDAGDAGTLLLFPDEMVYIIDARYIEVAEAQVRGARVVLQGEVMAQTAELLAQRGVKRLHLENQIPVALCEQNRSKLPGIETDASPLLSKAIMALREIKDEEELARMRQAQRITDDCFSHILSYIREGVREVDIMLEMEHYMRSHGAEKVAFETICVAGANTSLPHGVPGENRVKPGDFITLDFGAKYRGYCADMTRTVAYGRVSEEQKQVYATVLKAHLAGIGAARAGVKGSQVDAVARAIIDEAGYQGRFGHGLGHALGIEIHEEPRFSPTSQAEIKAGMMLSVEPGIYLPGQFGCRIEDVVHITETGCEPLPKSGKELIIL